MNAPALLPVTLHTPRLTLRPLQVEDRDAVFAIFSDAEVMRYWSGAPWTTMDQADAWLQRMLAGYDSGEALQLGVQLRDNPALIGSCALFNRHPESRRAEIGYVLAREHWGHGYMREAMHALVNHAFDTLDLRRLEADIDPANAASARLLDALGFVREGRLRQRWEVRGHVTDSDIYGLLRDDRASVPAPS